MEMIYGMSVSCLKLISISPPLFAAYSTSAHV